MIKGDGMPNATRLIDACTGHDACAAVPLITGSGNVSINGRQAGRQNDKYQAHGCDVHGSHNDVITGGSETVRINGLPAARIGDSISIGGSVAGGSSNVRIGG